MIMYLTTKDWQKFQFRTKIGSNFSSAPVPNYFDTYRFNVYKVLSHLYQKTYFNANYITVISTYFENI